ncbi:MAG: hypothetical protein RIC15_07580 [Vicingaceae bacterium]
MLNQKYFYAVLIVICFALCKPFKDSDLRIAFHEISPKLSAVELRYVDFANAVSYADPCACELNLISDEVVKNLSEHYGAQYGYIYSRSM